ncbi:MAG: GNAT family N-acetyltransferase [Spirochaetaceae bacterium]|jgi:ribosomal protein S18 acetylase RimI-like enzyme|nr:GNAT family N-acetyltransferase [Spirochaetaceae bacterium]
MGYTDKPLQIDERWWKAGEMQKIWPAEFLRAREATCVSACDRFLDADYLSDSIWLLSRGGRMTQAILMYSKRTLFPVLGELTAVPVPVFLKRFLLSAPVHAVHGLLDDVSVMEAVLYPLGYEPVARTDYYLMAYDDFTTVPECSAHVPGLPGLTLRPAQISDYKALFEMHLSYELEEVAVNMKRYKPELARLSLSRILEREEILVAEYGGELVGKINTNARSFTRRQLGGIYVKPSYRRMGIAQVMVAAMRDRFRRERIPLSLYVRKSNVAAQIVYKRAGFRTVADYRISYTQ